MVTVQLKQNVIRRHERRRGTQFTLLVKGRVKGVWEKKNHAPRLVLYKKTTSVASTPAVILAFIKRRRLLIVVFFALAVLFTAGMVVLTVLKARMVPLALPGEAGVIEESLWNTDEEAARQSSGALGPAVYKNLSISDYRVRKGETISDIARKNNLDMDTVISFNGISDARAVRAGTVLSLPNRKGLLHVVRRGDSLTRLSKIYGVSFDDLLDWNNLSTTLIQVGQKLFIPGGRLSVNELNRVLGKLFVWPAEGKITSRFGMRISPITGTRMMHNGIDISNRPLTLIHAVMPGRVAMVNYSQTFGKYVIMVHEDGFQTLYAHLETVYVRKGDRVSQGAKIARMGNTGASTGYHLHFSIFKNGREVDPLKYLN